jgi:hypothetical protein
MPGGQPGMNDKAAWNATPNNSAKPRTASRRAGVGRWGCSWEILQMKSRRRAAKM